MGFKKAIWNTKSAKEPRKARNKHLRFVFLRRRVGPTKKPCSAAGEGQAIHESEHPEIHEWGVLDGKFLNHEPHERHEKGQEADMK